MTPTPTTTGRSVPSWPKDAVRISFGIIWLIDAVLKWLPGFRSGYMSTIMGQDPAVANVMSFIGSGNTGRHHVHEGRVRLSVTTALSLCPASALRPAAPGRKRFARTGV